MEIPLPNYTLHPTQGPRHLAVVGNVDIDAMRAVDCPHEEESAREAELDE